jgi:hypothetical protein
VEAGDWSFSGKTKAFRFADQEAFCRKVARLRDISSIQAPTSSDRQKLFFETCMGAGNLPSLTQRQSVTFETGAIF